MTVAAIIQARMGSSRLPGKVLRTLGTRNRPQAILTHVLARARRIPGVDVLHATTTPDASDDAIVSLCAGARVSCSRGQTPLPGQPGKRDVLAGYVAAAEATGADVVMRLTSDCPLLDPAVAGAVLDAFLGASGCGYASNVNPPSWYDGCDVEIFSAAALAQAARFAGPDEREHVTTWMRRHPERIPAVNVAAPIDTSRLKLSVDDPADLERVRRVYLALPDREEFGWRDVVAAYDRAFPRPIIERALAIYGAAVRTTPQRIAYVDGAAAASASRPLADNPYSTDAQPMRTAWHLGWEEIAVMGFEGETT